MIVLHEQLTCQSACTSHARKMPRFGTRKGWTAWGNQADEYAPTWKTYANHSGRKKALPLFEV